jgi:hypothetical protein
MPRVVLDTGAEPDLAHHLDVVVRSHPEPLSLQQLALALELGEPLGKFFLDGGDRVRHPLGTGHIVGGREDAQRVDLADHVAGQRMQVVQRLDLVTEVFDADGQFLVGRDDLDGVAPHPKRATSERQVVAGVLHVDQQPEQTVAGYLAADLQLDGAVEVGLRCAQAVDARHRRHHYDIASRQQRRGRGVPQPLHIVVDRAVLFDVRIGLRDVRLGLVIVVIRDEVLDGVVRQHLSKFVGQLGGQRLVRRHHQGRSLQPLDEPCGGCRLPGTGGTQQHHVVLPRLDSPLQLLDGRRLVTGRVVRADHLEVPTHAHHVLDRAVFGVGDNRMLGSESHVHQGRRQYRHSTLLSVMRRYPC